MLPVLFGAVVLLSSGDSCVAQASASGVTVPVDVIGGRYFARWPLRSGGELRFYLDTGGGFNMLFPDAVRALSLLPEPKVFGGDTVTWTRLRQDIGASDFPPIPSDERFTDTHPSGSIRLLAPQAAGEFKRLINGFGADSVRVDGILGPVWFADRVWMLDYPNRRLFYHQADPWPAIPERCWVGLGFQVDSAGQRTMNFPRIRALIDGDSVDFLLDTGAMTTLTDSAWHVADPGRRMRATSFVITGRLERWHARHPDWPLIANADRMVGPLRMIRVPVIEVGGRRLGPVWFTERPDRNFQFFSQWMDRTVEGALGGTAWNRVAIVIDYPRSRMALLESTPGPDSR